MILLGGRLRTVSQSFVGPVTEAALERMSFDRAFMGADGVRADRGICEKDLEQTRLKELMMSRADHVYVLAHGAKLGAAPFHAWAVMPAALDPGDRRLRDAAAGPAVRGRGRRGGRGRRSSGGGHRRLTRRGRLQTRAGARRRRRSAAAPARSRPASAPSRCASSAASDEGADTATSAGSPAITAFCTSSKLARPLTTST